MADPGWNRVFQKAMSAIFSMLGPQGWGSYQRESDRWERVDASTTDTFIPGFVDIHIHGAFGIDFMSASKEEMVHLADQLHGLGYSAFYPTTVTATAGDVRTALSNLPEHPMIPGFHLEGPFISPEYPGAQPLECILDYKGHEDEWDDILSDPRLKVITLAPERPGADRLISKLVSQGVRVSYGHTNATFAECQSGFRIGARHTTHTYNAMRPLHHREAGTVGYALANPEVRTELIYDRIHVCKEAAEVLIQAKGPESVIAISDSTLASGLPSGSEVMMWGHACVMGDKQIRLKSNGALAGSAITLKDAFQNLADDFGIEFAVRATCYNPRLALGLPTEENQGLILNSQWEIIDRIAF